jgi:hypothetical protein
MKTILQEAEEIIYGDREETYGHPFKNLNCIASMWSAYLSTTGRDHVTAHDVCLMMVMLKVARLGNAFKRDSLVDVCGYAALADRLENDLVPETPIK